MVYRPNFGLVEVLYHFVSGDFNRQSPGISREEMPVRGHESLTLGGQPEDEIDLSGQARVETEEENCGQGVQENVH